MAEPGQEREPIRAVRVPDDLWQEFGDVVGKRNRSRVIREFLAWYVRRPRSYLPERPPRRPQRP